MPETQLALFASLSRWEIPEGRYSWRDGDQTIRVTIGAHCIDTSWKWWIPWQPWQE